MLKLNNLCKKIMQPSVLQIRYQRTLIKPKLQTKSHLHNTTVFHKAIEFGDRTALRDTLGSYTYAYLYLGAKDLAKEISKHINGKNSEQVLFLCPNDATYVITQWAIWMSGNTAVPASPLYVQNMLEYYARDCNSKLLITTSDYQEVMHKVAKTCSIGLYVLDNDIRKNSYQRIAERTALEVEQPTNFYNYKNAMILYTSGTTGQPKGVVLTHKNINSQISTLINAWKWTLDDVILHVLPLHHIHGIVNALLCPLYVGAKCNILPKYDSNTVWSCLLGVNATPNDRKITVFMGVPTIYAKLVAEYEQLFSIDHKMTEYIKMNLKTKVRLMVSGSAPLPKPLYEKWLDITGHKLLERYGMTEIGMCLSNEYDSERKPGYVGVPLPGVSIRLGLPPEEDEGDFTMLLECTNSSGQVQLKMNNSITFKEDPVGELLVKSDGVFKEYYNKPEITQNEFTTGKWFKTGDMCQYSLKHKLFKMLGRTKVDIIKTGGHKVSALEIETHLLGHPHIAECAVVGLENNMWGEIVAAVIVLKPNTNLSIDDLNRWSKTIMANYMVPRIVKVVKSIPKNAMGKVNKKKLISELFL